MDRRIFIAALGAVAITASGRVDAMSIQRTAYSMRKLRDHGGKLTSLSANAGGQRLIVVVMKGSWCKVCVRQLSRLAAIQPRLKDLGARVVGLSSDPPDDNREAAKKAGLPYAILSDEKHTVIDALGLWRQDWGHPMPSIILFDRCGSEKGRLLGRSSGQRPEVSLLALLQKLNKHPEDCGGKNA